MALQHITKAKAIAVAVPLLLGQLVGGIQGEDSITWFRSLRKPWYTPFIWMFPLVWTILYALMGYASYIVWTYGGFEAQGNILAVYGFQLALNLLWPILFFKVKALKFAQFENLLLLAFASLTANSFYRVDRLAGKLMWPYIAWLVLANLLNFSIARNNSPGPGEQRPEVQVKVRNPPPAPGQPGDYPRTTPTARLRTVSQTQKGRRTLVVTAQTPIATLPNRPSARTQVQRRVSRQPFAPVARTAAAPASRLALL